MSKVLNKNVDKVIKEITSFSCIDMFGHLYDLPSRRISILKEAEHHSSGILEAQLVSDLLTHDDNKDWLTTIILSKSKLEQTLTQIFTAYSPFWEQYYHRKQQQMRRKEILIFDDESPDKWLDLARTRYPSFFIILDAIWFASGERMIHHELIQHSLHFLLKSFLFDLCEQPPQGEDSLKNAMRILGPVNAIAYRNYLENLLSKY